MNKMPPIGKLRDLADAAAAESTTMNYERILNSKGVPVKGTERDEVRKAYLSVQKPSSMTTGKTPLNIIPRIKPGVTDGGPPLERVDEVTGQGRRRTRRSRKTRRTRRHHRKSRRSRK